MHARAHAHTHAHAYARTRTHHTNAPHRFLSSVTLPCSWGLQSIKMWRQDMLFVGVHVGLAAVFVVAFLFVNSWQRSRGELWVAGAASVFLIIYASLVTVPLCPPSVIVAGFSVSLACKVSIGFSYIQFKHACPHKLSPLKHACICACHIHRVGQIRTSTP